MSRQTFEFFNVVAGLPEVNATEYEGFIEDGIFALLYLLKRNDKECVVLTGFEAILKDILANEGETAEDIDWSHFSIVWSPDGPTRSSIKVPGGDVGAYTTQINECLSKRKNRFFLSLVTLVSAAGPSRMLHANVLFFDRETGTLERFEPYQEQLRSFRADELDAALHQMFQAHVSGFKGVVRPPDLRHLGEMGGLQRKAEREGETRQGDPLGFCLPWSILYADTRLTLPNQDPESIPELIEIMAKEHGLSLTRFIRNYTENFQKVNWKVYMEFLERYPEHKKLKNPSVAVYALFLKQLAEYASVYS